jgi:CTP synthase (UTP-ammonia lyase)
MDGVLLAIRFVREEKRPFLATCGGFQHAIIEFARNVLGLAEADHAESAPQARTQIISPLSCSLVEQDGEILLTEGSRLRAAYGTARVIERYHCSYGVNNSFRQVLSGGGLTLAGVDKEGAVRAVEIPAHPFFVGTLFQPERSALDGAVHPVIKAFLDASRKQDG